MIRSNGYRRILSATISILLPKKNKSKKTVMQGNLFKKKEKFQHCNEKKKVKHCKVKMRSNSNG